MNVKHEKGRQIAGVSIVLFVLALLMPGGLFAKIPEPDNIVFGVAGDGVVTVQLKVNDQKICSYTMGDNPEAGVFYILRIPMDSVDPLEPGTARPGETAELFIDDGTAPIDTIVLGERGSIRRLDLGTTDNDGDGIPDQWEQQIVDALENDDIEDPSDVDPMADFDYDGFSNIRELLAGSHPVDTEMKPPCWADVFIDGDVDAADLAVFADEYPFSSCATCTSDLDGDGFIDEWDLFFFSEDYGRSDCYH